VIPKNISCIGQDTCAGSFPGGKNPDKPMSDFYDNTILQELIDEGFLKNISRK
jgi:hypothetical protein